MTSRLAQDGVWVLVYDRREGRVTYMLNLALGKAPAEDEDAEAWEADDGEWE